MTSPQTPQRLDGFKAIIAFDIPTVVSKKDPVLIALCGVHEPTLTEKAREVDGDEWDPESFENCMKVFRKCCRTKDFLNKTSKWHRINSSDTLFFCGHMHVKEIEGASANITPQQLLAFGWSDIIQMVWDAGHNKGKTVLFPGKPQKPRADDIGELLSDWRVRCSVAGLPQLMLGIPDSGSLQTAPYNQEEDNEDVGSGQGAEKLQAMIKELLP